MPVSSRFRKESVAVNIIKTICITLNVTCMSTMTCNTTVVYPYTSARVMDYDTEDQSTVTLKVYDNTL